MLETKSLVTKKQKMHSKEAGVVKQVKLLQRRQVKMGRELRRQKSDGVIMKSVQKAHLNAE